MQLVIGQIVRPHGVRGEVVVEVTTDEPAARYAIGAVLDTEPVDAGPLAVEAARPHPSSGRDRLIVAFEGVENRDGADALRGVRLCVDSGELAEPTDPDEFHDFELIGLVARTPEGEELGEVVRIEHAPASDLLVLRRPGGRETLVPFVTAIVPEVDVPAGRLVVTPPGGLLDL